MKQTYQRSDFTNKNEIRWCPGCGDYAILAAIQKILPEIGLAPEKHVFVSGIGCAGRLPYYMNAYGFHTIHGRSMAVATGLKAMRDDLSVWVITGDGDALSIGGNHFIHCLRRNVNINVLLFNNQVYGLTKGQFSPTSPQGQVTKTSPSGAKNDPVNPLTLALGSGASFVARAVDKDPSHLAEVLKQAHAHQGCSFVEIYQDCHIFNKGAFDAFAVKKQRAENTVILRHGEPLLFGADDEKIIAQIDGHWQVKDGCQDREGLRHDSRDWEMAMHLTRLNYPEFPVPLGIFYQDNRTTFQLETKIQKSFNDLPKLYRGKAHWHQ